MGLQQWLAEEEERMKPEFLKERPKYYYYYEWMKQRVCATHPALPQPVMDKLLTMPANDLDLILQHKAGTTWKVICTSYVVYMSLMCSLMCCLAVVIRWFRESSEGHSPFVTTPMLQV